MKEENDDNIDIRGINQSKVPYKSCKVKCAIFTAISMTLLVAAAILIVAFWPSRKVSKCLVEVNLEEGDTLMYRVHQRFEVKGKDAQKDTISSIVGVQVANKTSDAYLFLLKINTTFKEKDEKVKSAITGYYRVRLPRKDYTKEESNETTESFELHGYPETDEEFVRYLHGLLYQLLPDVRRDLYEDIDGQKDKNLKPENSPLFPGPVRMHRQANTSEQGGDVMVKNHFSQSDLVNCSSDMDLDVKYTDSAAINKSDGMVSESNVFVSELLHFGEPIKTKDGRDVTTMRVTLYSHVIRIELDSAFFVEEEIKAVQTNSFVRLVVSTKESSWNETDGQRLSTQEPSTVLRRDRRAVGLDPNATATPLPGSVGGIGGGGNGTLGPIPTTQSDGNGTVGGIPTTQSDGNGTVGGIPTTQSDGNGTAGSIPPTQITNTSVTDPKQLLRKLLDSSPSIERSFSLFGSKILGIRTKGESSTWLKNTATENETKKWEMGTDLQVTVGSIKTTVYRVKYNNEQLEKGIGKEISFSWRRGIPFCFRVLIVKFCVEFSLTVRFNIKPPRLLTQETSLSPPKIAIQIESYAEVKTSVEAYASVLFVRAGFFADGIIVRVTVPTKLSYSAVKPANKQWCLASDNVQLTALELHAGLFYQWRKCKFIFRWFNSYIRCWWGTRNTILSFGRWAALQKTYKLYEICFK